jgi:anti-sigma factor RsiW
MDHEMIKDKIFELYDGELAGGKRQEALAHLNGCQECRELYQGWAKTAKVFFKAPAAQSSEYFVHRVMERVHELETPKPTVRWGLFPRPLGWFVPAVGLAVALMAVMPPLPQEVPVDLLWQDTGSHSSWAFSSHSPTTDETLQLVMEG